MIGIGKWLVTAAATAAAVMPVQAIPLPFHKGTKPELENTRCLTSTFAPGQTGFETITNTCTFPLAVLWASSNDKGGANIAYWDRSTPWRTGESHVQSWHFGAHDGAGKDRWRIACDVKQMVCTANLACLFDALKAEGPLTDGATPRDIQGDARKCNAKLTAYSSTN